MRDAFYQSLDLSYWLSRLRNFRPDGCRMLGAGTYFENYLDPVTQRVIKRLLPQQRWHGLRIRKSLVRIHAAQLVLIPPIEVFTFEEDLFVISLFGSEDKNPKPHWMPLQEPIGLLSEGLAELGYKWDDAWQIRCWEGIPFHCDVSDFFLEESSWRTEKKTPKTFHHDKTRLD